MNLEEALAQTRRVVPECVATGLVDMATGMLVGEEILDEGHRDGLELVASATSDLFREQTLAPIERLVQGRAETRTSDCRFQEVLLCSDEWLHLLQRCADSRRVLIIVCRASVDLNRLLPLSRAQLQVVRAAP